MTAGCQARQGGFSTTLPTVLLLATLIQPAFAGRLEAPLSERLTSARDDLHRADARLVWKTHLQLKMTTDISACHRVDAHLYAMGTDGRVRALRADNGRYLWTRELARPTGIVFPPTAFRSLDVRAVVFTRATDAIFLDPATGRLLGRGGQKTETGVEVPEIGPVQLHDPAVNSAVASQDALFFCSTGHRLRRYDTEDSIQDWSVDTDHLIRLAPLYLAEQSVLIVVDQGGHLAAITPVKHENIFSQELGGEPVGWVEADADVIYVATLGKRLHAVGFEGGRAPFDMYRLPGEPTSGPIVTPTSVYQQTKAGLQRVGKLGDWPNWHAPGVRAFLAEWPGRVVGLHEDGRIVFLRIETGELLAAVDVGSGLRGIPNTRNDAALFYTEDGDIGCLQPLGAMPLKPEDFYHQPRKPALPLELAKGPDGEEPDEPADDSADANEPEPEPEAEPEADETETEAAIDKLTPEEEILADPLRSSKDAE